MPTPERHDTVCVLDLGDGENRFRPEWLIEVNRVLDGIGKTDEPRALVTTATGNIWSNGLGLEWLFERPEEYATYLAGVPARLTPRTAHRAMVTARRFGGHDAYAEGIVDHAVDEAEMRGTSTRRTYARDHQNEDVRRSAGQAAPIWVNRQRCPSERIAHMYGSRPIGARSGSLGGS